MTDTGLTAHHHPATSHAAAKVTNAGAQRDRLLALLDEHPAGLTCYEAAALMHMSPNQVATRMMELRQTGLAVRLKASRPTPKASGHVHLSQWWAHPANRPIPLGPDDVIPERGTDPASAAHAALAAHLGPTTIMLVEQAMAAAGVRFAWKPR